MLVSKLFSHFATANVTNHALLEFLLLVLCRIFSQGQWLPPHITNIDTMISGERPGGINPDKDRNSLS